MPGVFYYCTGRCEIMQSIWWQVFDILGTLAFALSGSLVAISRRMDVFGIFVLAAATAVGGGIVRDLILGHMPPTFFKNSMYFWLIILTMVILIVFLRYINTHLRHRLMRVSVTIYLICDAIGLGSFTITGTLLGCYVYPQYWVLCIFLGLITAVGGGIIRDVLAGRIPATFMQDIYATASLIGALVLYASYVLWDVSIEVSAISCFIVTVGIRLLAIRCHWNLPRVKHYRRRQKSRV